MEAACATAAAVTVTGYARTPFGRFGGRLRDIPLPALGAAAIRAAIASAAADIADVDLVVLGVNFPGSDRSVARQAALVAGVGEDRNAITVDRACCSSLTALSTAAGALTLGTATMAVAGGAENLSLVPYFLPARWGNRLGNIVLQDQLVISCPYTHEARALQAGREALEWEIGRVAQDEWALRSQQAYAEALADGRFVREIAPFDVGADGSGEQVSADEAPRPATTLERLAALPTVYGSPTVTAGNAPDLSTGATAIVLRAGGETDAAGHPGVARLTGFAATSGPPRAIASIPAKAIQLALARAGRTLDDIDLIEINEAFAAVPLVSIAALARGDQRTAKALAERTNVNGGAIAIGHPTGATAARLVMTMISELHRRGGGRGVVGICGGIGEAEAVVVEVGPEHVAAGPGRLPVAS